MNEVTDREATAKTLEGEMAQVCGTLNAGTGRLVSLIARVLETESWAGAGIRSPEHWVAWRCGVGAGRARQLVRMARRLAELPVTRTMLEEGRLSEDQVGVICRLVPTPVEARVAEFATCATVAQLKRVAAQYCWSDDDKPKADPDSPERRRTSFGYDDDGTWGLSARLPADEGARVERALDTLYRQMQEEAEDARARAELSWADALVEMAERALGATPRPHRDRTTVIVHWRINDDGPGANLHLGPTLDTGLRRYAVCNARVRVVLEGGGGALSVGRAARIVSDQLRMVIEARDGGCRVPGCDRQRHLQVHHVVHWEDGGPTDTWNLVTLCSSHHRAHHLGKLGITGDADAPDGLVFTDPFGRKLTGCGRPAPPGQLVIGGTWVPPSGERLDPKWVYFN